VRLRERLLLAAERDEHPWPGPSSDFCMHSRKVLISYIFVALKMSLDEIFSHIVSLT